MISVACGTPTSLIPLSTRMNAKVKRSEPLGDRDRHLAAEQHAGNRAEQQPRHRVQVDVAVTRCPKPATQSSAAAWKMSVPTIFGAVSGKTITITSPKNVPQPTEVRPTTKPKTAPIATAMILSRR